MDFYNYNNSEFVRWFGGCRAYCVLSIRCFSFVFIKMNVTISVWTSPTFDWRERRAKSSANFSFRILQFRIVATFFSLGILATQHFHCARTFLFLSLFRALFSLAWRDRYVHSIVYSIHNSGCHWFFFFIFSENGNDTIRIISMRIAIACFIFPSSLFRTLCDVYIIYQRNWVHIG